MTGERPRAQARWRTAPAWLGIGLALLAIGRLGFHAFFLPAYEGPDEPHHLGRILAFAERPIREALRGVPLDGRVIRAVELRPCGPGRPGCPPFGAGPGPFNLLHPLPSAADERRLPNPENHQPPLFYLASGVLFRLLAASGGQELLARPDALLLGCRLLSLFLVAVAVLFPLRALLRERPRELTVLGLLLLLLPGASEALIRCSNDAALFLWAAFLLDAVRRRAPTLQICLLASAGPLLKLTALPLVAFAVVSLWARRLRRDAALVALSGAVVFPVQALRGWLWGGTYEFNRSLPAIHEAASKIAVGLLRSFYTIAKTVFWLGGWSFFRAPAFLVIAWFLLLAGFVVFAKRRAAPVEAAAHLAGAAVALAGCVLFFIGNRRFYGDWGGVGGWYVWGWVPWLLLAYDDLGRVSSKAYAALLAATALFLAIANVSYLRAAIRLYS